MMEDTCFEDLIPDPTGNYAPIPKKFVNVLLKRGMISIPVTEEQDASLKFLQSLWQDESKTLLRFLLAGLRRKDRELLVQYPGFGKLERFIYNVLSNAENYHKSRSLKEIQQMVLKNYGVNYPLSEIRKIRFKVYNDKKSSKNNPPKA